MTNEQKLTEALQSFRLQYKNTTSADLQTFIIGWNSAIESSDKIQPTLNLADITADNMNIINTTNDIGFNKILCSIHEEASNNNSQLYLRNYNIKTIHKKELERRGFTVDVGGRYNEIDTIISW